MELSICIAKSTASSHLIGTLLCICPKRHFLLVYKNVILKTLLLPFCRLWDTDDLLKTSCRVSVIVVGVIGHWVRLYLRKASVIPAVDGAEVKFFWKFQVRFLSLDVIKIGRAAEHKALLDIHNSYCSDCTNCTDVFSFCIKPRKTGIKSGSHPSWIIGKINALFSVFPIRIVPWIRYLILSKSVEIYESRRVWMIISISFALNWQNYCAIVVLDPHYRPVFNAILPIVWDPTFDLRVIAEIPIEAHLAFAVF